MERILKYKNQIMLIILFFLFWGLHKYVVMYGDDYWYAFYHNLGFFNCVIETAKMYLTTNGRLIPNIFNSLLFYFDLNFWRVLNCIMICITIYLISKIVNFSYEKKYSFIALLISGCLFLGIDVLIFQESILWITGSSNYLYPLTLVLANSYLVIKYHKSDKNNCRYLPYVLILTTFFSSFLVEQSAIANGILIFSIIIYDFFVKKAMPNKIQIICFLMSIIAFGLIVFSPGCQTRVINEQSVPIIEMLLKNFNLILSLLFFYRPFQYINIFISVALFFFFCNFIKSRTKIIVLMLNLISTIGFIYILVKSRNYGFFDIINQSLIIKIWLYSGIMIFLLSLFIFGILKAFYSKDEIPFSIFLMGYASQVPMLFVPTMGFRTVLVTYLSAIIIFCYLYIYFIKNTNLKKTLINCLNVTIIILFILYAGNNYYSLYSNYQKNSLVLMEDEKILRNYKSMKYNGIKEICLKKAPLSNYRWMLPYESQPHMPWYRLYYEIPDNVEIIFE